MKGTYKNHDLTPFSPDEIGQLLFRSSVIAEKLFPHMNVEERNDVIGDMVGLYGERVRKMIDREDENVHAVFAEETNEHGETDFEKYSLYKSRRQISNPKDSAVLPIKGPGKASLHTADIDYYGQLDN